MKDKIFIFSFIFLLAIAGHAQENGAAKTGFSVGLQINQYQNDFGGGINLAAPYFANEKMTVRLRGNVMFLQHVDNNSTAWTPYMNLSIGLVGVSGNIGDYIRLYGEGGLIGLFPSGKFSSENFNFGGYGVFGFEFFMAPEKCYFIEIGGVGTGAAADLIPNAPFYSNGILISTGFRAHF